MVVSFLTQRTAVPQGNRDGLLLGFRGHTTDFTGDRSACGPSREESDNLADPDVLAQEVVVPRLASLGTTPSQGQRPSRGRRRGVEDLEAALE